MEAKREEHVLQLIGCSLIKRRPVFSIDSKYTFVASGETVRVYSTETGQYVHKLVEDKEVKCVLINPRNHLQLIVCTEKGRISFWDYVDCIKHRTIKIKQHLEHAWMPKGDFVLYVLSADKKLLKLNNLNLKIDSVEIFHNVSNLKRVSIADSGNFAVLARDSSLHVYFTSSNQRTKHFLSKKEHFTCCAAHPRDSCFATGNILGKIFIWFNIDKSENFVKSTLHWHQLPVADLCFSSSGVHLLSVGEECVLVKWKLNGDVNDREFSPRLGLPMKWVNSSIDGTLVATCHIDNAIHLINSRGKLILVIQGITQSHFLRKEPVPSGLHYEPTTGSIVLNGKPGHLQFYSLREDKQLFNLDITQENYHHREREFDVAISDVTRAAISSNWLATVQVRDDSVTSVEVQLKFWKYLDRSQNFSLNTKVDLPQPVNALVFGAIERRFPVCVTTSDDQTFKIWAEKGREHWKFEGGSGYRQEAAGDADFNIDSSLLAVVFTRAVTLWDPESIALKSTLYDPFSHSPIKFVRFGAAEETSHLLVSVTENKLTVWDVLKSTVQNQVNRDVNLIVHDPLSKFMAAFDKENLFIFSPDELNNPVCRLKVKKEITAALFVARSNAISPDVEEWEQKSQLWMMDREMELYTLSKGEDNTNYDKVVIQSSLPMTPLGVVLSHKLQVEAVDHESGVAATKESADVCEIFSSASNMLPSPQKQCVILHKQLYLQRKIEEEENENFDDEQNEKEANEEVKRKRQDSYTVTQKDVQWSETFDWLSSLFVKL